MTQHQVSISRVDAPHIWITVVASYVLSFLVIPGIIWRISHYLYFDEILTDIQWFEAFFSWLSKICFLILNSLKSETKMHWFIYTMELKILVNNQHGNGSPCSLLVICGPSWKSHEKLKSLFRGFHKLLQLCKFITSKLI